MNKKLIRLTESDLHRIVKESVKKVLMKEMQLEPDSDEEYYDYNDDGFRPENYLMHPDEHYSMEQDEWFDMDDPEEREEYIRQLKRHGYM